MTTDTPLLPCPFCGGQPIPEKALRDGYANCQDDPDAYAYTVRCRSCAAEGGWAKSATSAARWWNMRQPNNALVGEQDIPASVADVASSIAAGLIHRHLAAGGTIEIPSLGIRIPDDREKP